MLAHVAAPVCLIVAVLTGGGNLCARILNAELELLQVEHRISFGPGSGSFPPTTKPE